MSDVVTTFAWACLAAAALPALLFLSNLRHFRRPCRAGSGGPGVRPGLSVLIPARNEESSIAACVESVLASRGVDVEVVVLDDQSDDRTAAVAGGLAARDFRVRLEPAPPLPSGWCGKQHACWSLAGLAAYDRFVFLDADVRLHPDALARAAAEADRTGADLLSGFPSEETGTFAERLVIPLIQFLLLGFLPIGVSRRRSGPAWAAGCGQFFLTTRAAYARSGGHAAIRRSLHDGLTLPRAYRRAGLRTDLVDLSGLARCRMYRSAAEVWRGFAKNATEGFAAPPLIAPVTAILVCGQVLPPVLAAAGWLGAFPPRATALFTAAAALAYLPRAIAVFRFGQSPVGAALHPFGVAVFLAIQWAALAGKALGRTAAWKGRSYTPASSSSPPRVPRGLPQPSGLSGLPRWAPARPDGPPRL